MICVFYKNAAGEVLINQTVKKSVELLTAINGWLQWQKVKHKQKPWKQCTAQTETMETIYKTQIERDQTPTLEYWDTWDSKPWETVYSRDS